MQGYMYARTFDVIQCTMQGYMYARTFNVIRSTASLNIRHSNVVWSRVSGTCSSTEPDSRKLSDDRLIISPAIVCTYQASHHSSDMAGSAAAGCGRGSVAAACGRGRQC